MTITIEGFSWYLETYVEKTHQGQSKHSHSLMFDDIPADGTTKSPGNARHDVIPNINEIIANFVNDGTTQQVRAVWVLAKGIPIVAVKIAGNDGQFPQTGIIALIEEVKELGYDKFVIIGNFNTTPDRVSSLNFDGVKVSGPNYLTCVNANDEYSTQDFAIHTCDDFEYIASVFK